MIFMALPVTARPVIDCDTHATLPQTSLKIHEVVGLQSPLSHELYLPYCNAAQ